LYSYSQNLFTEEIKHFIELYRRKLQECKEMYQDGMYGNMITQSVLGIEMPKSFDTIISESPIWEPLQSNRYENKDGEGIEISSECKKYILELLLQSSYLL